MPSPVDSEGPRRLLIAAGTVHFPGLGDLTQVPEELRRITDGFKAMGYQRQDVDRSLDPTSQVLLDSFSRVNEDSRPGDLVVAYYSGHGVRDAERFYLLALASDPLRLDRTAAAAEDLARALVKGSKAAQVLFILDACYAGAGAAEFAELVSVLTARLGGGPAVFVLAAARPKQEAAQGALTTALARALSNSDERLGGRTQRFLTMEEVMGTVGDELRASHPAQTATLSSVNTDGLTRLFPNPHYRPEIAPGMDLEAQRSFIDHWIPKAGGTGLGATGWYFTGRETVLSELGTWMRQERSDGRPRVVTGRAGSGKSAVIARIVTLADARYRKTLVPSNAALAMPSEGAIDVAVHARRKSLADVIRRIASSLSLDARDPVELVEQISRRSAKTVIVVDALDEALDSEEIAARLLRPLAAQPHVFLLVATRPDSVDGGQRFTGFGEASVELDLDSPRYTGAGDVAEYVRRRLVASEEPQRRTPYTDRPQTAQRIAQALAERANKVFLVAHTATLALLADPHPVDPDVPGWTERLPTGIEEAFEQFLAGQDARGASGLGAALTRAVLLPLAFAEGEGLPWSDLWAAAASRFAGQVVSDETVAQVRRQTAAFIVEASEDERSVYRLYHERVAEYLRQSMPASALPQLRMFEALLSRVPALASGERDWRKAHPYLKKHMAAYAAKADALATVIEEPFFLGVADPESLVRHLAALAHSHASIVRAYRRAFGSLRDRSEAERGPYLALALLHEGRDDLAQALTKIDGAAMWTPLWTLWRTTTASHVVARGDSAVSALSTGWWGPGVPVGLVGRESGEVEVWQLTDGRRLAHWKAGIGERVTHVKLLTTGADRLLVACWASGEIGTHDLQTQTSRFNAEDTGGRSRVEAMCLVDLGPNHGCATFHRDLSLAVWELPSLRLIKRRRKASRAMTYDLAELKTASGSVIVAGGDSVAQHGSGSESRLSLWSTGLKPLWKSDPNESGIVQGLDVVSHQGLTHVVVSTHQYGPHELWRVDGHALRRVHVGAHASTRAWLLAGGPVLTLYSLASGRLTMQPVQLGTGVAAPASAGDARSGTGDLHGSLWTEVIAVDGRPSILSANLAAVQVWSLGELAKPEAAAAAAADGSSAVFDIRCLSRHMLPSATLYAGNAEGEVVAFDAATGRRAWTAMPGRTHSVTAMSAFDDAGVPMLAVACGGTIELMSVEPQPKLLRSIVAGEQVSRVSVAMLGGEPMVFASVKDEAWAVRIWNARTGEEVPSRRGGLFDRWRYQLSAGQEDKMIRALLAVPHGQGVRAAFASRYSQVMVLDHTGAFEKRLPPEDFETWRFPGRKNDYVCALACSTDGKRLAAATDAGDLALWSFESGQLLGSCEGAHLKREINALAFQPYGPDDKGPTELLVSGGNDGVVRFWTWVLDLAPCYQIEIGTAITALSFVARNRLAVATASGLVMIDLDEALALYRP